MATLRLRTGTSVTSRPCMNTRPRSGLSSPAISRISVVLPANVSPSSTLKLPGSSVRLTSSIQVSPPTVLLIPFSCRLMVLVPQPLSSRRRQRCRLRFQPLLQTRRLGGRQPQSKLSPAPENVIAATRPLVRDQIAHLSLIEIRTVVLAQIGQAGRTVQQQFAAAAVVAGVAQRQRRWQPGMALAKVLVERVEVGLRQIASGQRRTGGPGAAAAAEQALDGAHGLFRQAPISGDLATIDGQYGGRRAVQLQSVVAGHGRRVGHFILIVQRADAGIAPDHVIRADLLAKVARWE